jgi:hypothetical protein
MHAFARSVLGLAVMGLAAAAHGQVAGDYPDRYAQTQAPASSPEAPREDPSPWPAAPETTLGTPPRVLPAEGEPPRPLGGEVRQAGGFAAAPVSAETKLAPPVPLSRDASGAPSPLGGELPPIASTAASLGVVVGVFLLVAWVVRRGMPKGSGLLPSDAVEVLGRAPLVGRQQVHLVRCGHKLVLVTVTPSGTQTLTEITDPAEVDRLLNLCQGGMTAGSLRGWLGPFTRARGTDYRERPGEVDFRHLEIGQHR